MITCMLAGPGAIHHSAKEGWTTLWTFRLAGVISIAIHR